MIAFSISDSSLAKSRPPGLFTATHCRVLFRFIFVLLVFLLYLPAPISVHAQSSTADVTVAANGQEALDALSRNSFDLVLMDVQMPEMDGLTATSILRDREREHGGNTHVAVIALTAHAMKGDQDRCLLAGMDGYLTKPIRPQELDEVLSNQLKTRNTASRPTLVPEPIPGEA